MANAWLLTERQRLIETYLRCAANFYGHITPRAFLVLFNRYNDQKLLKAELMKYCNKLMRQYPRDYVLFDNAVVSTRVESEKIDEIIYYQGAKKYYIPSKEDLMKYLDNNYYENTEYTEALREFLVTSFHLNMFSAESLVRKISWLIRIEEPTSTQAQLFSEHGIVSENMDQLNELLLRLQNLNNNTRKWANCGYTPTEMFFNSTN